MQGNPNSGAGRPYVPTFADIQRRTAELCPQSSPAPAPQPAGGSPRIHSPRPIAYPRLGEAALYGVAGSPSARSLRTPRRTPPPFSSSFSPPSVVRRSGAPLHGRRYPAWPQPLRGSGRRIQQGSQGYQVESDRSPLRGSRSPWVAGRVSTARLTPGSLIHALRDQQPPTDRRLLVLSEEFAAILHSLGVPGSPLALLRCAWDSGDLHSLDGRSPIQASGTHISLIAHITQRELAQHLHPTETHNGSANRCLWALGAAQQLPGGGR